MTKQVTVNYNGGHYKILYDESNRYPEKVFKNGEEYMDITNDHFIRSLCEALYQERHNSFLCSYNLPPIGGFHD